jgi:hypothetical protein
MTTSLPRQNLSQCQPCGFLGDPAFHGFDHMVVELDGEGGCLVVPRVDAPPAKVPGLTMEAWVRPSAEPGMGRRTLLSLPLEHHPLTWRLLPRGGWELGQDRTWVRAAEIGEGRWQHLAGVCRHEALLLYRNAKRAARLSVGARLELPGDAVLGATPDEGAYRDCFRGQLGRVRLWSRALEPEELRLAMAGLLPAELGQLADWPLDEGLGSVSPNRAPLAQRDPPGTPFGAARFHRVCGWPDYVIARIG